MNFHLRRSAMPFQNASKYACLCPKTKQHSFI